MSDISRDLQKQLSAFVANQKDGSVTPEMAANLRACIESSPTLVEQMNLAVAKGYLKRFALMNEDDPSAGALYDSGTIKIPPQALVSTQDNPFNRHDMVFVLGHETQHGFNARERNQAVAAIAKEMNRIARSPAEDNYDGPTAAWQQAARVDEAKASLAGWNAAVSQLRNEGRDVTLQAMYESYPGRAYDFIDQTRTGDGPNEYTLKPGIVLKDDMSADIADSKNVAALGQYYYDNQDRKVGHARSTYANYTGATIISHAVDRERHYHSERMTIDLARHGMSEPELERNGISLGRRLDSEPRHAYIDTSDGQQRPSHFDHTKDDRVSADQVNQYVPIAPSMRGSRRGGFDDPDHPDHALYETLRQRLPADTSEDRLIQITAACHMQNFRPEQVDSIAASGDMLYIRSNGPDPGQRVNLDLTTAPPTQQATMQQVEAFDRQQELLQAQWQEQQRQTNERAQQGPALSL